MHTLAGVALLALATHALASPPYGYDIIPYWRQPALYADSFVECYPPYHGGGLYRYPPRYSYSCQDPWAYGAYSGYSAYGGYGAYGASPSLYRYHAPSYGYHRHYLYPRRPAVHTVYGEISSLPPPRSYDEVVGTPSDGRAEADAWRFLADGDARHAMASFIQAAKESDDAGPKVGYALAASELGDETTAIWAMRRAFRFDAAGTRYLPLDAELAGLIDDQRRYFEYDSQCLVREAWFMVAALHLVAHEDDKARAAVYRARDAGDRSYELRRLERELERGADPRESAAADAGDASPS